jgi:ribosomal protein L7/L12
LIAVTTSLISLLKTTNIFRTGFLSLKASLIFSINRAKQGNAFISVTPEQQFKIKSFWTGFRYSAKTPAHDDFEGKIPTIKFCREQWGWGLKDAKDIVEAIGYGS